MRAPIVLFSFLLLAGGAQAQFSIAVDPGHGGTDPGAVGCGLEEADVNLSTSLKLKALIDADPDLSVVMTRTTDVFISLAGRVDIANDAGVTRFASIHANAFNGSANGIETYCYTSGSTASFDQRNKIHANMIAAWPLKDRGVKTAGFYVIANTSMPASLSELAFVDACATDAPYLASDFHLQEAAVAHHQALRESLGLPVGVIIDPPPSTGTLKGVVFEDQGVGLDDTSVRLPGATVVVTGPGATQTATANSPNAGWSFTLDVGTWTVTTSLAGYIDGQRVCQVSANADTWCSVGMYAEVVVPPDPGPPVVDVSEPVDTWTPPLDTGSGSTDTGSGGQDVAWWQDTGAAPVDTWSPPQDTGSGPVDTWTPTEDTWVGPEDVWSADTASGDDDVWTPAPDVMALDGSEPAADVSTSPDTGSGDSPDVASGTDGGDGSPADANEQIEVPGNQDSGGVPDRSTVPSVSESTGCTSATGAPAPTGAWWVLLLGLGALLHRRRAAAAAIVAFVVGCTTSVPEQPVEPVEAPKATVQSPMIGLIYKAHVHETKAVESVRLAQSEGLTAPEVSPDGTVVLATTPRFDQLVVLEDGARRVVTEAQRCGWAAQWEDDQTIGYRAPHQPMHAVPMLSVRLDGQQAEPPMHRTPGRYVRIRNGAVWMRVGDDERKLSIVDDTYCCARLEHGVAVFQGATSGAWAFVIDKSLLVELGHGNHPRVHPHGTHVVFDRSTDDGAQVLESQLIVTELSLGYSVALETPPMARWPSFGPDGKIYFEADGALYYTDYQPPSFYVTQGITFRID